MKRLRRDEKGQALILALILLLIGGLIAAPLLAYMGTGLLTGEVYDRRTAELYAADAGVEDALWKIQNQVGEVKALTRCDDSTNYTIANVNNKSVAVTITLVNNLTGTYRVESTATGDGSGTKIEAYITANITYNDYSGIMSQILTIQKNLTEKELDDLINDLDPNKVTIDCPWGCGNCRICGTVYDYNSDAYKNVPAECKSCVAVYNYPSRGWPTADFLSRWYEEKVRAENPEHYYGDTININLAGRDRTLGPVYVHANLLTIDNSRDKDPDATLSLTGTMYVTGRVLINPTQNLILDLGGNTIFIDSGSVNPEALYIKGKCAIKGPGAIIVRGSIYFEPNITAGTTGPVFIMSVERISTLKPGVDFYGAVAGSVDVEPYPGTKIIYPREGFGSFNLTFPNRVEVRRTYRIASWQVSPL